jgi:very-short-patch-repair endonuclease
VTAIFNPGNPRKIQMRQQFIESIGVEFLRFRNNEIRDNLGGVLEAIYRKIREMDKTR